ncbi:MAG TPA: J domain-containing protein [Stellaceae bacterium]|nr:J domain-containing protein [Stellaceae bacterium]
MARPRPDLDAQPAPQPYLRCCEHPNCAHEGAFRAPRSRTTLNSYYWFCLDHVREYNAAWNFYAGMSEREIEEELRHDTVWQRPTWPMGWRTAAARGQFRDAFNVFEEDEAESAGPNGGHGGPHHRTGGRQRQLSVEELAMQVFEIEPPFSLQELKARYKLLVKRHHPDANGGDKAAEERLKVVNQAYATLKAGFV